MSLQTSREIYSHSLAMVRSHPKLLVFVLLNMTTWLGLVALFLPALFHATTTDVWQQTEAGRKAVSTLLQLSAGELWKLPLVELAGFIVTGMILTSVIRFAFYSQTIRAMNGGDVAVLEGFRLAISRLPVIGPWALLASSAGALASLLERLFGFIAFIIVDVIGTSLTMRRLTVMPSLLLGVPWTVAAHFVIPVMLNEPQDRNPIEYLKISARLVRRVWGEALVIGVIGASSVGFIMAFGVLGFSHAAAMILKLDVLLLWGGLACFAIYSLTDGINGIFRCCLYVYATEGVAPGPFDAQLFDRAWVVK